MRKTKSKNVRKVDTKHKLNLFFKEYRIHNLLIHLTILVLKFVFAYLIFEVVSIIRDIAT